MGKKEELEVIIDQVDFPSKAVAYFKGQAVKFKGGIPGQVVRILAGKKRGRMEGKLLGLVKKSPLEERIPCPPFGRCGGCAYQSLPYEKEKELLLEQMKSLYQDFLLDQKFVLHGSPCEDFYRNKMEYSFGDTVKDGPLVLGLHEKGHFYSIIDTTGCRLAPKDFERIRQAVAGYFKNLGTSFYHKMKESGFLRHLMLREGGNTKEILVNLFTTSQGSLDTEDFVSMLLSLPLEGKIVGILHTIYDGKSDKTACDTEHVLYGERIFRDRLLDLDFFISPYSFFQTNSKGAELLYGLVLDFAGDVLNQEVFDLYSGTGTMAQIFATKARHVKAVEIVPEAVEAAKLNARHNHLSNISFHTGDVMEFLGSLGKNPDLVILDPPREGIHPKSIGGILDFRPKRFVYVSCNPITHVRDLKIFKEAGYHLRRLEFVDMFPRTPNVEAVSLLERM